MGAWLLIAVSVALAVAAFAVEGLVICLLPLAGLGLAGMVFLRIMGWRWRGAGVEAGAGGTQRAIVIAFAAGFAVAIHVAIGMGAVGAVRLASMSVVAAANLRGVGYALRIYHEKFQCHAPTLFALVAADLSTRKQLVTPFDPSGSETPPWRPLTYSSFEYRPGVGAWVDDAPLILAHERAPFCTTTPAMIGEPGWFVLFASGEVRWLKSHEFEEALEEDRKRRKELGWDE